MRQANQAVTHTKSPNGYDCACYPALLTLEEAYHLGTGCHCRKPLALGREVGWGLALGLGWEGWEVGWVQS